MLVCGQLYNIDSHVLFYTAWFLLSKHCIFSRRITSLYFRQVRNALILAAVSTASYRSEWHNFTPGSGRSPRDEPRWHERHSKPPNSQYFRKFNFKFRLMNCPHKGSGNRNDLPLLGVLHHGLHGALRDHRFPVEGQEHRRGHGNRQDPRRGAAEDGRKRGRRGEHRRREGED